MKVLVFGATGRVGTSFIAKCIAQGNEVVALVRKESRNKIEDKRVQIVEGDIYDQGAYEKLNAVAFDVVVNVIGTDPMKPSSIFADTTQEIIKLLETRPDTWYVAITGTAQMKKSFLGKLSVAVLKISPIRHAVRDHQNAYDLIRQQKHVTWSLVGCPYIKDGPEKGSFTRNNTFGGGFKWIHPGDVANAILEQIKTPAKQKITGVWY